MFTGSSSAKAILMGEHFVVHGAPALAVPVNTLALKVTLDESVSETDLEGHLWHCYRIARDAFDRGCRVPLTVQVRSTIPEGAGLGSSAALSIAMARAVAGQFKTRATTEQLRRASMECERKAHGKPSGIDTEVCLLGRPVFAEPGKAFTAVGGAGVDQVGLLVINTGPGAATAGMIERVSDYRATHEERFHRLAEQTRERAIRAREALVQGDVAALGRLLTEQHEVLREIGVSTAGLDAAVQSALAAGAAGAKLSGSGGGGVAVAVAPPDGLDAIAARLREAGHKVLSAEALSS